MSYREILQRRYSTKEPSRHELFGEVVEFTPIEDDYCRCCKRKMEYMYKFKWRDKDFIACDGCIDKMINAYTTSIIFLKRMKFKEGQW